MIRGGKIFLAILGLPKTLYFNFKYFDFRHAIQLPVLVSHRVNLEKCGGTVKIDAPIHFGMVKLGYGDVGFFDHRQVRSSWKVGGAVLFHGAANLGNGFRIYCGGLLEFGANFKMSCESQIYCFKKISFGEDVLVSWETLFMDSDFHKVIVDNQISNSPKEITIGDRVWIGCRCVILKGAWVSSDVIIAANSTVAGLFAEPETAIGGSPAKIIKRGVKWEA